MTAISKAFVVIADTAVDPDSPIDSTLMTGLRDNDIHLREWLGASFEAGAIQDHNHDGSNSALVPVGPNLLRNGSFENGGLAGWLQTVFGGGTIALSTTPADVHNGVASAAITSTVLANGGGSLLSNEYVPVSGGLNYSVFGDVMASAANVSGKIEVVWYDINKAQISISTVWTSSSVATNFTTVGGYGAAPSTARFMQVLLTGGIPATGAATGTIYFDGLVLNVQTFNNAKCTVFTSSGTFYPDVGSKMLAVMAVGGGAGGAGNDSSHTAGLYSCGGGGFVRWDTISAPLAASYGVTVGAGGAGGTGAATGGAGGGSQFGAYNVANGGTNVNSGPNNTVLNSQADLNDQTPLAPGISVAAGSSNGTPANSNTGGGGGGSNNISAIARSGGNGGSGIVFVWEYK